MSPRLTIRRVHRDRRVTRPPFVTRCASTDARVVCFEILRGGRRARVFSAAARAAAGAGRWFDILLASFVVAPTSGSRPPSPSPRPEAVVLQLKRIGEAQAIAGCTEQQVTRLEQRIGQECDIFLLVTVCKEDAWRLIASGL